MKTFYKAGILAATGALAVGSLAACSGSSNNASTSPTATPTTAAPTTTSPTPTTSPTQSHPVGATCTKSSLTSIVPNSATITKFNCGTTGGGQIAAVQYVPTGGPSNAKSVVFAKTSGVGGQWDLVNKDQICGTASAGLPPEILAYCKS